MVFHNTLDYVFATWSHIAVLRVFQDSATGMTGREIARLSHMNHRSCLKALSTLEQLSIIRRQRGGRDHRFFLNRSHILVQRGILPILKIERALLHDLTNMLVANLGKPVCSIILFGSVARKEEGLSSDLDICVIAKKDSDIEFVQSLMHDLTPRVEKKFGARLASLIMAKAEFAVKARNRKAPVNNILKEGVVLSGRSLRELSRG